MMRILEQARRPTGPLGTALARDMAATHGELYDLVLAALGPALRVLEIGCGSGAHIGDLARRVDYTGVDHSPDMIAAAQAAVPCARFICGDVAEVALPACDAVFAVNVLQWLRAPVAALIAVRRALVPGGRFVAGVPDHDCPRRPRIAGMPLYTRDRLAALFCAAGFRGVDVRAVGTTATRYLIARGEA